MFANLFRLYSSSNLSFHRMSYISESIICLRLVYLTVIYLLIHSANILII